MKELGTLDQVAVFTEPLQSPREAGPSPLAITRLPMQATDFAVKTRGPCSLKLNFVLLARGLIVCQRVLAPAGERQQIAKPFPYGRHLSTTIETAGKRSQRPFVVPNGILVSIDRRPIARGKQIVGTSALIGGKASVMAERL